MKACTFVLLLSLCELVTGDKFGSKDSEFRTSTIVLLIVGIVLGVSHIICWSVSCVKAIKDRAAIKQRNKIIRQATEFKRAPHNFILSKFSQLHGSLRSSKTTLSSSDWKPGFLRQTKRSSDSYWLSHPEVFFDDMHSHQFSASTFVALSDPQWYRNARNILQLGEEGAGEQLSQTSSTNRNPLPATQTVPMPSTHLSSSNARHANWKAVKPDQVDSEPSG
ncbi:hypothetical protein T265_08853 [Opisthorchis viverrini]|uniref:Uncharacterized protein n=1 Tax=Opisthorchis viverrini TaxID=6198 RepID=A0A075A715_OPIVI|nr:hypothetical protein T265_08853 [Opisthorchis viverrini]KER23204.1 hypothetical protein T265_08853 [Opisthorchis viverrini]